MLTLRCSGRTFGGSLKQKPRPRAECLDRGSALASARGREPRLAGLFQTEAWRSTKRAAHGALRFEWVAQGRYFPLAMKASRRSPLAYFQTKSPGRLGTGRGQVGIEIEFVRNNARNSRTPYSGRMHGGCNKKKSVRRLLDNYSLCSSSSSRVVVELFPGAPVIHHKKPQPDQLLAGAKFSSSGA